jgi:hypothetical protein
MYGYGYDTISQANRDPGLRASDAEREATADRLRKHHTDGRLDSEEFQERLDRCFAARTAGELAELTRDLPADQAPRGSGPRAGFGLLGGVRMIPIAAIILAILAVHLLIGAGRGLWVLIPLLFLVRLILSRRWLRARRGRGGGAR